MSFSVKVGVHGQSSTPSLSPRSQLTVSKVEQLRSGREHLWWQLGDWWRAQLRWRLLHVHLLALGHVVEGEILHFS